MSMSWRSSSPAPLLVRGPALHPAVGLRDGPDRAARLPSLPRLGQRLLLGCGVLWLAACVSVPAGPGVTALPGSGRSFDQFRYDEAACRQYASAQVGGATANSAAADSTVRSAALGTVIGAVAGAAIGGHNGAGVGAGVGLLTGTLAGAGAGDSAARGTQSRYDSAYVQCMYAKGHKVPVSGRVAQQSAPPAPGAPVSAVPPWQATNPNYRPPAPAPGGYGAVPNSMPNAAPNSSTYGAPGGTANVMPPPPPRYLPPSTLPPPGGYPPRDYPAPRW